jgi:NAD(P)-dependent dehydrogenase (short-subunit alcohol dehydrogenase family)
MLSLKGKSILVTGGAGIGVGSGICQAIDLLGGNLVVNDLSQERADKAASQYQHAIAICADISNPDDIARMFTQLEAQGITLDGLVNNAGVGLSQFAHNATEVEFDRLLGIDLRGVWMVSKAFTHHVLKAGKKTGSIVNISSVHAKATMARYALYASAKSGVEGLTRGLAVELGPMNIRCNALAPGYVHSEQNIDLIKTWAEDPEQWIESHSVNQQALEFRIEPLDCGWLAAFLLSDLSRAITGQVIPIDAGMTALIYNKDFL